MLKKKALVFWTSLYIGDEFKILVDIMVFLMHLLFFNYELLSIVKNIKFFHSRLKITLVCGEKLMGGG